MNKELVITPEYLASQGLNLSFPARFWSKLDKTSSPHGCWLWIGYIKSGGLGQGGGYGQIWKGGSHGKIHSHQAAWILCCGPIPEGMDVCHDCPGGDNRRCCNPAHLRLDTHAGNQRDMFIKGTSTFGEKHRRHKLTWEEVCAIRSNPVSGVQAAEAFGVSRGLVSMIRNFKNWNHPLLFR